MTGNKAIVIKNLCKEYYKKNSIQRNIWSRLKGNKDGKAFYALKDINLEINKGEVIGIIGPNGAGKSTLLKILAEVTPPTRGEILISGKVASILQVGIGFQPELSGYENIFLSGRLYGLKKVDIEINLPSIISMFGFENFLHTPVKYYSSGMYMRLAFALIAYVDADIYLLDEVLSVGDAIFRDKVLNIISTMANNGKTVLIVTHAPDTIYSYCDKILILNDGSIQKFDIPGASMQTYNQLLHINPHILAVKLSEELKIEPITINTSATNLIKINRFNLINVESYGDGTPLIVITELEKADNTNYGISIVIKDELNKPIAEIKMGTITGESGIYKIESEIPARILNPFKYIIDLFIYEGDEIHSIYPKIEQFVIDSRNLQNSYCMLNLGEYTNKIIKTGELD